MSINISPTLSSERYFRVRGVRGVCVRRNNLFRFIGTVSKAAIQIGEKKFETSNVDQKLASSDCLMLFEIFTFYFYLLRHK